LTETGSEGYAEFALTGRNFISCAEKYVHIVDSVDPRGDRQRGGGQQRPADPCGPRRCELQRQALALQPGGIAKPRFELSFAE